MDRIFFFTVLIEVALVGGVILIYPRIARKGLLFGVYVGEGVFEGDVARRITRSWYRAMGACVCASLLLGGGLALLKPSPGLVPAPMILLLAGFLVSYLRAYRRSRTLAPAGPPPPAVAPLTVSPAPAALLPAVTLAAGAACGAFAVAYAWIHYADLPPLVPTHFGLRGLPDAWRPKSFFTVMLLPILALVTGVGLGGTAFLTAHAKRALRRSDRGASLEAQMRFRAAVTRFLCGISLLVSALLTALSVSALRIGLGNASKMPPATDVLGVAVVAYALGGTIYLALRYGQGGARIERARADTPLTDGLADNRHWVLGMFYVNRDDPSILVERRFGLGYTLNFGNWKAAALLGAFLALTIGLALVALLTN